MNRLKKGDLITYLNFEKEAVELTAAEDIQIYHKFAIRDIADDEPIVKYGEHIGHAAGLIKKGEHVHVHNVKNVREDLG